MTNYGNLTRADMRKLVGTPGDENVATLHYVEFCINNIGIWDRAWFATEEEAQADYDKRIASGEFNANRDDGSYGSIIEPQCTEVALSIDGLLHFANNFAVDRGA